MNHLEAQSCIMPFIEGKLPDNKQLDFVMHMNTCKECHDELEIYYTLINGMQQRDQAEELTGNYPRDLSNKLKRLEHRAKGRRRIRMSAFSVVMLVIGLFMVLFYGRCLVRVYEFEQGTKLSMQGEYYYVRMIGDVIFYPEDRVRDEKERAALEEEEQTVTYYDRVKAYIILEEYSKGLWQTGADVVRQKAGTYVPEPTTEENPEETSEETVE